MSTAEILLALARSIDSDDKIREAPEGISIDVGLARCKVALDFVKRRDLVFRALVEDWNYGRIIMELY